MVTHSTIHPTLYDFTNRLDPQDAVDAIAHVLEQSDDLMQYQVWKEGNLLTGHRTTVQTGLPQPTWRKLNGGVQPSVGKTAQITFSTGILADYAEVDADLAELNGNTAAWLASENRMHLEGLRQEYFSTKFYGNEGSEAEAFTGLLPMFNSLSAPSGENIIVADAGASGNDQTSMWLIGYGQHTVHGIFPKGMKAGWHMEHKGKITIENADGNGGRMEGYRTYYSWKCGLAVPDWRYVVRIGNIDTSALTGDASGGAKLVDCMTQAVEQIYEMSTVRPVFVCNRKVRSFLRRQMVAAIKNSTLTWDMVGGKRVFAFDGVPVVLCDQILNTESPVGA